MAYSSTSTQCHIWEWQRDDGGFSPYPADVVQVLEDQFNRTRSPSLDLQLLSNSVKSRHPRLQEYVVDFTAMEQVHKDSGYRRHVKRTLISLPPAALCSGEWSWELGHGLFVLYDFLSMLAIEEAFQSRVTQGTNEVNLSRTPANLPYTVSFQSTMGYMMQTRHRYNTRRRVQRFPLDQPLQTYLCGTAQSLPPAAASPLAAALPTTQPQPGLVQQQIPATLVGGAYSTGSSVLNSARGGAYPHTSSVPNAAGGGAYPHTSSVPNAAGGGAYSTGSSVLNSTGGGAYSTGSSVLNSTGGGAYSTGSSIPNSTGGGAYSTGSSVLNSTGGGAYSTGSSIPNSTGGGAYSTGSSVLNSTGGGAYSTGSSIPNSTGGGAYSTGSSVPNAAGGGAYPHTSSVPNAAGGGAYPYTSSVPNAAGGGAYPYTSSVPNAAGGGAYPYTSSVPNAAGGGAYPYTSSVPNAAGGGAYPNAAGGTSQSIFAAAESLPKPAGSKMTQHDDEEDSSPVTRRKREVSTPPGPSWRTLRAGPSVPRLDTFMATYVSSVKKLSQEEDEPCPVCLCKLSEASDYQSEDLGLDLVQMLKCSHRLHRLCFQKYLASQTSMQNPSGVRCPTCKKIHGTKIGDMPKEYGSMQVRRSHLSLPGHEGHGRIEITYSFRPGRDMNGRPFYCHSFPRVCYLPASPKGQKVLRLLQVAWDRRLTFTIGTSVTTGATHTVVWNEIHHKTECHGNASGHGYPDPNYLDNVLMELESQGVTDDDLD